jgi:mono/diheme cytochrome c family protein
MHSVRVTGVAACLVSLAAAAATLPGDAKEGSQLFVSQKCVTCHSVGGEGGSMAPDLARKPEGRYTPALMASALWNHAPEMWSAMEAAKIAKPQLTPQQAADLFAYFYTARYFEQPGDAGRGKRAFEAKGCIGCHGESSSQAAGAPPISQWESVADPIELARAMWNHAPKMLAAISGKMTWPTLSAQEMTDIVVYVQNLPAVKKARRERRFAPASAATGEILFREKGCAGCHTGANSLGGRLEGQTLAGLAAAMWNHAPQMRDRAQELWPEEMTRLVGYLWSIQYFDSAGDPSRGARVVEEKRCTTCHGVAGTMAPNFATLAGKLDAAAFVSATWQHGPEMLSEMKQKGVAWPRFAGDQLSHLLAYINSL